MNGLSRAEVARELGVSTATVHRMRMRKELDARLAIDGVTWVYDPGAVLRLASRLAHPSRRADGEVAARSFELFDQGKDLRQVVVELRESPEIVRQLYREWRSELDDPPPPPTMPPPPMHEEDPITPADILAQFAGTAQRRTKKGR